MQFTTALLATLFSAGALAAPASAPAVEAVSQMAATTWTIESMQRQCGNGQCRWQFTINTGDASTASCNFVVVGSPATETDLVSPLKCGSEFQVTTGWNDGLQWGPGNGFTTLSVVNTVKKLQVWPAYQDKELAGGLPVVPNKSYTPQTLP